MKIAFITDYSKYTGIGAQNYNLFMGLKRGGAEIDIINLVSSQGFKEIPDYGINIISNVCNNKYLSFGYGVFYKFPKELKKVLKKGKYTHIILGHQGLAYLGKSLQKKIKTTIIIHDLFTLYGDKSGIDELIYNNFLLKGIDKIKNIVFISEFTKNDFEKYYGKLDKHNYAIIYQGIDKQEVNHEVKESLIKKYNLKDKKIILNVGSESPRKNIKTYLEVANHFKNIKDLLFVRIGKPSSDSETYISEQNLKNILYCSGVSDEELIARYDIAKIVLSTSTLEGYGRQIFEGYLYNNYVVTSDVSDVKKIFGGENSTYVINDPYDTEKYYDVIDKILTTGELAYKKNIIPNTNEESEEYYKFLNLII